MGCSFTKSEDDSIMPEIEIIPYLHETTKQMIFFWLVNIDNKPINIDETSCHTCYDISDDYDDSDDDTYISQNNLMDNSMNYSINKKYCM